jgi:hypothetical protein
MVNTTIPRDSDSNNDRDSLLKPLRREEGAVSSSFPRKRLEK